MKQFSCGDVIPGCGGVIRAEDEPRVLALARAHAREDHGADPSEDVMQAVQRAIHTV